MTEKIFAIFMTIAFAVLFAGLYIVSLSKTPNLFYKKVKNPVKAEDLVPGQIYYLNGWQEIEFVEVKESNFYIFKKMDNTYETVAESNLAYFSATPEEDDNE